MMTAHRLKKAQQPEHFVPQQGNSGILLLLITQNNTGKSKAARLHVFNRSMTRALADSKCWLVLVGGANVEHEEDWRAEGPQFNESGRCSAFDGSTLTVIDAKMSSF